MESGSDDEQAGNGPSRRPAQGSKEKRFSNMQKDIIVSSILQCQKIPEAIRIRLGKHIFSNW